MRKIFIFIVVVLVALQNLYANYSKVDLKDISGYNLALRSAVCPGLGQIHFGKKTKGYFFMGLTTFFIVGAVSSWNSAENKYNNYVERGHKNSDLYGEYRQDLSNMYMFAGFGLITWLYSVYDAYKSGADIQYYHSLSQSPISMNMKDETLYVLYNKKL